MTGASTTLLSVRAEAQLEVAPDEATLSYTVEALEKDKAAALRMLGQRVVAATDALRDLGGAVRGAGEQRRPLAWLVRSSRTEAEQHYDRKLQRHVATGRIHAHSALVVFVRDFQLLERIDAALAIHHDLHMHYVSWHVDRDNPGWQQVRAAAAEAAVAKARDYAGALGGALVSVEHVADVGLLGERGDEYHGAPRVEAAMAMGPSYESGGDEGGPTLDPVPQELQAVIEARFLAALKPLS